MLDLKQIKEMHDKAYEYNQVTRERAAHDLVFYWVTMYDSDLLVGTQYQGEFNILRKAGRQIIADLRSNPVQVNFDPKADSREDGADILDGLYLSDDRVNTSLEAYDNASIENVVCGVGAWELYTEYESTKNGNRNQVIRRKPVYEANNNCFWDPNAKRLDKSDANYNSILTAYTPDGYKELVSELTGEAMEEIDVSSFKFPEESYSFPWINGEGEKIYVVSFYHRELVKDKVLTMIDPFGQQMLLRESDLNEIMDELIDQGFSIESKKEIKRWQVTKYIASGADILKTEVIAGENIPVVPVYGERAFIEGEEHYEGVTRLAKDPQTLRNFLMNYLADIVSQSPRPKPMFTPEQVQGHEYMYEENGADNNYPYYLQNSVDLKGNPLPLGPVGVLPEQQVPQALIAALGETKGAVEDVANPGLPQDIADPDLSGKAVMALQNRLDQQSIVYQQNMKHAKRRDGEIYASMATEVYDAPRKVTLTSADGTRKTQEIMQYVMDEESGDMVMLNDLTNMEFDVYADIGPSYTTKKEETLDQLEKMAVAVAPSDPALHKILILKQAELIDGVGMEDVRDYARKQLILQGIKEPETDEDKQMLAQAQQSQEPDPMMIAAMAEMEKAKGEQMKVQTQASEVQRKAMKDQADMQNEQDKRVIDMFKAQTDRMGVQVNAQEAGANITHKNMQTAGQRIDNSLKLTEPFRASVSGQ